MNEHLELLKALIRSRASLAEPTVTPIQVRVRSSPTAKYAMMPTSIREETPKESTDRTASG